MQLLVGGVADLTARALGLEVVQRPQGEGQLVLESGQPVGVVRGVSAGCHLAPPSGPARPSCPAERRRARATSARSSGPGSRSGPRVQRRRQTTTTTEATTNPAAGSTNAPAPTPPLGVSRIQRPYRATYASRISWSD